MGGPGSGPRPGQRRGARSQTGRGKAYPRTGVKSSINVGGKSKPGGSAFIKNSPSYGHNYVKTIRGERTGITTVKKSVLRGDAYAKRNSSTPYHMRRVPASKRK